MMMSFPDAPRVIYRRNQLIQVICQLRFPAILRIDTELPVAFQDRLRTSFPNFMAGTEVSIEIQVAAGQVPPPEILRQGLQPSTAKNYAFISEDGSWQVNLTRAFIGLITTRYERWESFRGRLDLPLSALVDIYQPGYFTRIGLRYVNIIQRSKLGLERRPWRDLLSPTLIGMLGSSDMADSVDSLESVQGIRLSAESTVRIITSLAKGSIDQEETLTIDSDFVAAGRIETSATLETLNSLNSHASKFARWAIAEPLYRAMEPEPA